MVTKKNIYHYILYVIFALIFFCGIGLHSLSVSGIDTNGAPLVGMIIRYAIVFVSAALIILAYKIFFPRIPSKYIPEKIPVISKLLEMLGLIFIVLMMIFARTMLVAARYGNEVDSVYLNYALGNSSVLPDTTMASYIYASICTLLCKIHYSVYPIYVFNGLLNIGSSVFTYFIVKRSFRMRYAILALLLLGFMPGSIASVQSISPDIVLNFLFIGFIYYLIRVNELNIHGDINAPVHVLFIVGLGFLSGFIASLDIIGVSLAVIAVSSLIFNYNKEPDYKFQKRHIQVLIYLGTFIAFLFIFLYVIKNNGFNNIENVHNYINSFIPDGLTLTFVAPMEARAEGIIILIFSAIAILAFIRSEYDKGLFMVIIIDLAFVFSFVKLNNISYPNIINLCYIIIAVIGFFAVPSFIITPDEEFQREIARQEKEKKRRAKEYEKNKLTGNLGISLESVNEKFTSDVSTAENKPDTAKEESPVSPAPKIPDAYKNPYYKINQNDSAQKIDKLVQVADSKNEDIPFDAPVGRKYREIIPIGFNSSSGKSKNDNTSANTGDIHSGYGDGRSMLDTETIFVREANEDVSSVTNINNDVDAASDTTEGTVVFTETGITENTEKSGLISLENSTSANASEFTVNVNSTSEVQNTEDAKTETETEVQADSNDVAVSETTSDNVSELKQDNGIGSGSGSDETNVIISEETQNDKPAIKYDNDTQNRDKIIPSRRDYKTAHVFKSKEEEVRHDQEVEEKKVSISGIDPELKATPMIKNPLPVPKPHVPKELTYDYDLKDDELEFDIIDLKGKDYYDI
ncbi:MAG: hypothetical protein K6G75_01675 [Lachnospiraceae bacterium]|nr:hypothetical protein [Lachnospiraceae bacterium]